MSEVYLQGDHHASPSHSDLFQYALTKTILVPTVGGGWALVRMNQLIWKGRPCVGIQLSKELIPNSDGGRRWNGLIDRSVTRICSEVGDRKAGGWVGLDIFGHQEGKEHKLIRILIQPQLLSKFKPKKMQVLRLHFFFLKLTLNSLKYFTYTINSGKKVLL